MEQYLHVYILILISVTFIYFNLTKNILHLILTSSIISLLSAGFYLFLDAPDVAITEVSITVSASILALVAYKKLYSKDIEFSDNFRPIIALVVLSLAVFLLFSVEDLPAFGEARFNNYYLQESKKEISVNAVVTAILASYRGYDTLFETCVIFIGGIAIANISGGMKSMLTSNDIIIKTIIRIIFPLVFLYTLYIQFHGEISPGGGFQAGAILAIYSILAGFNIAQRNLFYSASFGVLSYFLVGLFGLLFCNAFLDYSIIGQASSIMLIEIGIAITVGSTIILGFRGIDFDE